MKKALLLFSILIPFLMNAQSHYTFRAYRNTVPDGYNFWVSIPDTYEERQDSMPIILFLHGHSLCGTDLNRVRKYGCLDAISMGRDIDALIVAPQNPGSPWVPRRIQNVLDWVREHYPSDTNRLYVIGMSQGGYGTFDYVSTYPEKVAAAMALCGGSSRRDFCGLNLVPLWIIHGTADRAVPLSQSQRIVDAMKACGSTELLRFDKFKGVNHSQLAKMFYLDDTYRWLMSHSLADSVRTVNKEISITVSDMGNAYQNINRSANSITVLNGASKTVTPSDSTQDTNGDTTLVSPPNPQPTQATPSKTASKTAYHIVKKGDTLYSIARRYHTTVDKLCKLNHIKETSILSLGQKIKLR